MKIGRVLFEMILFFLVFFLPGYLSQSAITSSRAYGTSAMLQSILIGAPQCLLMVYIVTLSRDADLAEWGFIPLSWGDALRIVLLLAVFFGALLLLAAFLPPSWAKYLGGGFRWRLSGPSQIPLALAFGLVAGYREEFFFRSYLLKRFETLGFPVVLSVAFSTVVFCLGHLYEGRLGLATSGILGVSFAAMYLRRRSIHVIAISHGLYNAIVLCLSLLRTPPLS
jgi:hypothetical protein